MRAALVRLAQSMLSPSEGNGLPAQGHEHHSPTGYILRLSAGNPAHISTNCQTQHTASKNPKRDYRTASRVLSVVCATEKCKELMWAFNQPDEFLFALPIMSVAAARGGFWRNADIPLLAQRCRQGKCSARRRTNSSLASAFRLRRLEFSALGADL